MRYEPWEKEQREAAAEKFAVGREKLARFGHACPAPAADVDLVEVEAGVFDLLPAERPEKVTVAA